MLISNVLMLHLAGFFRGERHRELALHAERQIDCSGNLRPWRLPLFDLLSDLRGGRISAMKLIRQAPVFAKDAEQQVLALDRLRAELAGFVTREEDGPARLLGVSFEQSVVGKGTRRAGFA